MRASAAGSCPPPPIHVTGRPQRVVTALRVCLSRWWRGAARVHGARQRAGSRCCALSQEQDASGPRAVPSASTLHARARKRPRTFASCACLRQRGFARDSAPLSLLSRFLCPTKAELHLGRALLDRLKALNRARRRVKRARARRQCQCQRRVAVTWACQAGGSHWLTRALSERRARSSAFSRSSSR